MKLMFFKMIKNRTANRMHDALRLARRARGIKHKQRTIEFHASVMQRSWGILINDVLPIVSTNIAFEHMRFEVTDLAYLFQSIKMIRDVVVLLRHIKSFAVEGVTIAGEENLWLHLSEALDDAFYPKVRGGRCQVAPKLVVASIAIMVCGICGK